MADKAQAITCGGLGAIHLPCQKIGLVDDLNERVNVLKRHLPYHESDHVLNLAYNIMAGGVRLEDIELRRNDENYLNGLGAQRIPDPTTAGDFTRRFTPEDTLALMEAIHASRQRVWQMRNEAGYIKGRTVAERFDYDYTNEEVEEIAQRAREVEAQVNELHLVANNNRSNYAPRLAERLQRALGQGKPRIAGRADQRKLL